MSATQPAANPVAPPTAPGYSASSWTIHKWAMGSIADYWMYAMFAMIMLVFTTGYHLDAFWVGLALVAPRLIDSIIDPLVGHLSDITHTSWGRRRPFLAVTALIGAFLVAGMWWASPGWPTWLLFLWLAVAATLVFSTWGTFQMAHQAFGYELSDDYNDRSRVFAIFGVYHSLVAVLGGYFYLVACGFGNGAKWIFGIPEIRILDWHYAGLPLLRGTYPNVGGEINGLRWLALIPAAMIILAVIGPLRCKERFVQANRTHVKLWAACKATITCRPFVIMLLVQIARTLGTSLTGVMWGFIGIYYVCQGNKDEYLAYSAGLGAIFGAIFSLLMWPAAKPLTKKIGKRWGLILTFGISFAYSILLPFIVVPGEVSLMVFIGFLFIIPNTFQNLFLTSIMPDICDLDELHYGERREGLFSAVKSVVNKVEISFCTLIGSALLTFVVGYDPKLAQQAPEVLQKMLWWAFTPKIIFSAVALALTFAIPITEKMMVEVRAQLTERRRAAEAQAAANGPSANS